MVAVDPRGSLVYSLAPGDVVVGNGDARPDSLHLLLVLHCLVRGKASVLAGSQVWCHQAGCCGDSPSDVSKSAYHSSSYHSQ